MAAIPNILLLAPNIPQVYVALALIRELELLEPKAVFKISSRDKYEEIINEFAKTSQVELFPAVKDQIVVEKLSAVIFIGHSYFQERKTIEWAGGLNCLTYWVNAHFEKQDLLSWEADRTFSKTLVNAFDQIFYEKVADKFALENIGFSVNKLQLVGNAKYDCAYPDEKQLAKTAAIIKSIGAEQKKIIVAGSIASGDECEVLLYAFGKLKKSMPNLLLILAPRSLDHLSAVKQSMIAMDLKFSQTSKVDSWQNQTPVLLVDQMGLLKGFYRWATVAFIGRTLFAEPGGGSNIIEPAAQAIPIVIGPFMNSFLETLEDFKIGNGIKQLSRPSDLLQTFHFLLTQTVEAKKLGSNGLAVVKKHAGALRVAAKEIVADLVF